MPPLPNARHERFAQELAKGKSAAEAARLADVVLTECEDREGYYVYLLVDPRDDKPFYVGKGLRRRAFDHVRECRAGRVGNPKKHQKIAGILAAGEHVRHVCVSHQLTQEQAFDLECRLIRGIGRAQLTNWAQGIPSEGYRLACQICADRKRLRTFCDSMENVWPKWFAQSDKSMSREAYESHYWDVQGSLSRILAHIEGRGFEAANA